MTGRGISALCVLLCAAVFHGEQGFGQTHPLEPAPLKRVVAPTIRALRSWLLQLPPPEDSPGSKREHGIQTGSSSSNDTRQPARRPLPYVTDYLGVPPSARERERLARQEKLDEVSGLFRSAGVTYPPKSLFFRVFKLEQELEVWGADVDDGPMTHVATYPICYSSGKVGPKEREGDLQVPEGFYLIDSLNPGSRFFLSMHINYPNELDRHLQRTGSAIMIHGSCVSIGCLAMTTERIMELYLMVKDLGTPVRVPIHLFPQRDMASAVESAPTDTLRAFWTNLKDGHDRFAESRMVPRVRHRNGRYVFP